MVSSFVYVEGGGNRQLDRSCRRAFGTLLERSGFRGRMPRLVASRSRNDTYDHFKKKHEGNASSETFVAMLIDSEDPVDDIEKTWDHLRRRDDWTMPASASDEQVLLMTTSMETWIVADVQTLREHYGASLRESHLPSLQNLEDRERSDVFDALEASTRDCTSPYAKGRNSFIVLGKVNPDVLKEHLPSFNRVLRILEDRL